MYIENGRIISFSIDLRETVTQRLGEGECIQVLVGHSAIYLHGNEQEMRQFAEAVVEQIDGKYPRCERHAEVAEPLRSVVNAICPEA